ncbi:TfuA-like protein [Pelagibius marinus]|uniref:TfuA-like protein n=1 Tax=Pelagibius marinus TaxID=2762760 RepID=UPI0018721822|nr:TfuA-like protein [Pelagibius marinus]
MTAVFLGPSLPRAEAEKILAADYHPPVRQGDIYRLVQQRRPRAIAVIDGYFQEVPSVWHKEILWALDQGIPVYGAASMGALRAAELQRHGMIGIGKIYEAYRVGTYTPYESELFEDDDEVAVIHGPAELSYPALSDAMVDLRETLAAAARDGLIDEKLRDGLVAAFKRRFYRERSFAALPELLAEMEVDTATAEALTAWLPQGRISQKRADARALLEALAESEPEPPAEHEPFIFERTTLWAQFVEQADDAAAPVGAEEGLVLEELYLEPDLYTALRRLAVLRLQLLAPEAPPPGDDAARRAALDQLRRRHGLLSRAALEAWAEDCDLDREGLDRLLAYEAAVESRARSAGAALAAALLDVLRSEGHYPALAARARDKQERLERLGKGRTAPSALSSEALVDWYFESRLGRAAPSDVAQGAREMGFADVDSLRNALAREQAYLALAEESR